MGSILLILVIVFIITSSSATSRVLKCRRCLVHVNAGSTVGSGSAPPFFPQQKPEEEEEKPNVGAVVGFTFLLAFLLLLFVCVYRMRRTATAMGSRRRRGTHTRQDQMVVPTKDNPAVVVVGDDAKVVEHNNRPSRAQDDKKRVEPVRDKKVGGYNHGLAGKPAADRPLDEVDDDKGRDGVVKGKGKDKKQVPDRPLIDEVVEKVRPDDGDQLKGGVKGKEKIRADDHPLAEVVVDKVAGMLKGKRNPAEQDLDPMAEKEGGDPQGDGNRRPKEEAHEDNVKRQAAKRGKDIDDDDDDDDDVKAGKPSQNSLGLTHKYTYEELKSATNDFHPVNKIGGGAFGTVYKGTLPNGTMIAVKCLKYVGSWNNRIDDFKNEVEALGRADHPNLVKLIGYFCSHGITRILVYEYMCNGSLDKWIFRRLLSWAEMKKIIKGIAKGLVYLHDGKCEKTIILHRDLKPGNVVLDEKKNAKLCDFGIAKLLNKDQTSTSTYPAGTPGYMAPESFTNVRITDKVDVYSFGVLALEVMFGKHFKDLVSLDKVKNKEEVIRLDDLISNLSEEMRRNGKEIKRIGGLAKSCIRDSPDERPSMKVVLAGLRAI